MKSITFNRNSLHYRLATVYGNFSDYRESDRNFCSYSKQVLLGLFKIFIMIICASFLLIPQVIFLIWASVRLTSQQVISVDDIACVGAMFITIEFLFYLIFLTNKLHEHNIYLKLHVHDINEIITSNPSFIKTWYQSIKDKTCVKIDFN
jgi:hypothetical protein